MSSHTPHVLYGSHASYATAKTRSYLRKKGIPFVERLPASKRFREYVRPTSENHRIPQLEAPDGTVVQDTTAIFDYLEERFPEPPAYPPGPRQQLAARLFEVLLDAELGRVAWHYRWNYMDENYAFVGREFGRSFRPQGTNGELDHYGGVIAERMEGKRAGFGDSEALRPVLESIYAEVLEILEAHFTQLPYFFGGLPSIADHVLMGSLFGHLARDPEPSFAETPALGSAREAVQVARPDLVVGLSVPGLVPRVEVRDASRRVVAFEVEPNVGHVVARRLPGGQRVGAALLDQFGPHHFSAK